MAMIKTTINAPNSIMKLPMGKERFDWALQMKKVMADEEERRRTRVIRRWAMDGLTVAEAMDWMLSLHPVDWRRNISPLERDELPWHRTDRSSTLFEIQERVYLLEWVVEVSVRVLIFPNRCCPYPAVSAIL